MNLTLRVGPLRGDGYHEIESLVVQIGLCDRVRVIPRDDEQFAVQCGAPDVPTDESNLALRAARLLARGRETEICGVTIDLEKRIPVGAGLGGGSSDAAATLLLLNQLWGLNLPTERLTQTAAQIGSDVPLFLNGPAAIVRGRGEHIEPVCLPERGWIVLILPAIQCDTRAVYDAFEGGAAGRPRPPADAGLACSPLPGPGSRLSDVLDALASPQRGMDVLFNDLEPAAMRCHPALSAIAQRAAAIAGGPVRMSGSGSTLYRLFAEREAAETFAEQVSASVQLRTVVAQYPYRVAESHEATEGMSPRS